MSDVGPMDWFARWRGGWLLAATCVLCIVLWGIGQPALHALRYERAGVMDGEVWRLATCHFVHLDGHHLVVNLAGLLVIAALFARDYPVVDWCWIAGGAMLAIGTGLLLLEPQLDWYVGLSGVLHGALAAGAVSWWRRETRTRFIALALLLGGKLVYEQWLGPTPLVAGLPVIVDAHLYGAIGGGGVALGRGMRSATKA